MGVTGEIIGLGLESDLLQLTINPRLIKNKMINLINGVFGFKISKLNQHAFTFTDDLNELNFKNLELEVAA